MSKPVLIKDTEHKSCPFKSRMMFSFRPFGFFTHNTICAGARCMAWREVVTNKAGKPRGYCGLAGKPE